MALRRIELYRERLFQQSRRDPVREVISSSGPICTSWIPSPWCTQSFCVAQALFIPLKTLVFGGGH